MKQIKALLTIAVTTLLIWSCTTQTQTIPTATNTSTPSPTRTATPMPKWTTSFAEPILKAIADRPPTYQDDFSDPQSGWYVGKTPSDNPITRIDGKKEYFEGEYRIVANAATSEYPMVCSGVEDKNVGRYEDFVAEFDVRFVSGEDGEWELHFHRIDIGLYSFKMPPRGGIGFYKCDQQTYPGCGDIATYAGNPLLTYAWNHIVLIVRGPKMAAYVNEVPILYTEDKTYTDEYQTGYFMLNSCNRGATPIETRWDNFKVWDISNLP